MGRVAAPLDAVPFLARIEPGPTVAVLGLLVAQRRDTGTLVRRAVACVMPGDFFAKAAGPGERWITVHPNGKDEKGVPVLIRESQTEKGTYHIIGGAGGKLKYLRLTGVKSPEEAKKQAEEKRRAKKDAKAADREAEKARKAGLSKDELKEEASQKKLAKEGDQEKQGQKLMREKALIERVAQKAGWDEEHWKFDKARERAEAAGVPTRKIEKLEEAHHKQVMRAVRKVVKASKLHLVAARDKSLGEFPIESQDEDKIGLTDMLKHPETPRGKGYQSITKESSDDEIRAGLAQHDIDTLRNEAEFAEQQARDKGDEASVARLRDVQGQLRTAELVRASVDTTPEKIEERRTELRDARKEIRAEQLSYHQRLTTLAEKHEDERSKEEVEEIADLEERAKADKIRLGTLEEKAMYLDVLAGESVAPAVKGEKAVVDAQRKKDREDEIRAEGGQEAVDQWNDNRDRLRKALEKHHDAMRLYKETGVIQKPDLPTQPIVDPEEVVQLIAQEKALGKMDKDMAKEQADDAQIFGKGYFTDTGDAAPEMIEKAEQSVAAEMAERQARAFLERAESPELLLGRGGQFVDDTDNKSLHRALERHMSAGAYNVVNNVALSAVRGGVMSRVTADTLGPAGAAQLLAIALHKTEGADFVKNLADTVGEHHIRETGQAEEHIAEMEDALDRADEAMASITDPSDLAAAARANDLRQEAIEEARQTMGQALGEYEATAACVKALKEQPVDEIHTTLGPIGSESAIRQMRSLGLAREDYTITSDGTNQYCTVHRSGFDKMIKPVDAAKAKLTDELMAIKRGEHDEDGWMPKGMVVRPASTFTGDGETPPAHSAGLRRWNEFGTKGDPAEHMRDYIARRAADGDDLSHIAADCQDGFVQIPDAHREKAIAAYDAVFPSREKETTASGKPVYQRHPEHQVDDAGNKTPHPQAGQFVTGDDGKKIQSERRLSVADHRERVEKLIGEHFAKQGLPETAAIHGQELKLDHPHTAEALHRALAKDPRAMVAFTPLGDLTGQDARACRSYFLSNIAKVDAKTGVDAKGLEESLAAHDAKEPSKAAADMFGGESSTPEWLEWNRERERIKAEAHESSSSWPEYVSAMGGRAQALRAIQDHMKSGFVKEFHRSYTTLHGEPLRLGTQEIDGAVRHAGYLDPELRKSLRAERAKAVSGARNRDADGRYDAGDAMQRYERQKREETYQQQRQMGLGLGGGQAAAEPMGHQRHTIGARAEGQLASIMPQVAKSFHPDRPVKLIPDVKMSGKYIVQQRMVKAGLKAKRMSIAAGVGAGKTNIGIACLAHARQEPERGVKRGLFLVPSAVQGQFGGEFARFADPQKMSWAANPGGDHAQRMAEHSNPDTHAVVHTHQGYRDTMLKLMGEHWGTDDAATKERFMGLGRKEAAAALKEVWSKHGIDYQMSTVDEGHLTLDRLGKPDSLLSRIVRASSDNTPYHYSMTADPIKNDVSELGSLMSKMHPDGQYDDTKAWMRQYGVNTTAAADALKREVAGTVYAAKSPRPVTPDAPRWQVDLHPKQAARVDEIHELAAKLRAAHARGAVDVETARKLSPDRFTGPASGYEGIVKDMQRNPGIPVGHALRKAIDGAPAAENAKIQRILDFANGNAEKGIEKHDAKEKPVVIFARSLAAVDQITAELQKHGHRAESFKGEHSSEERENIRGRFNPDEGEASTDFLVLSDAGEAGLNLQRGQTLIQYDRPHTAKTWMQRKGRIDRTGQMHGSIDLVDLVTNSDYEAQAQARIDSKYDLRSIITDPGLDLDESGMGAAVREARLRTADPVKAADAKSKPRKREKSVAA